MITTLFFIVIPTAFILGRLTDFKADNKIKKLELDLSIMTEARDHWRTLQVELITKIRLEKEMLDEI